MLNIKDYEEQIIALHKKGMTGKQIVDTLHFKYHQPVYNYFRKRGWPITGKITKKKHHVNDSYFEVIDTEKKAYILGFLCADGHITHTEIQIEVAEKDIDILYKIQKALGSDHPIRDTYKDNPYKRTDRTKLKLKRIKICSVNLTKPLLAMGLGGKKTYSLNSSILNYVPKYLIRDFLRGYFDGDGNVFFGKKYASGIKYNINICGNEEFLMNTFQKYFPSTNKLYKDLYSKQCYIWKISSKEKVLKFLHYLYYNSSIFLSRKYLVYRKATCSYKTGLIAGNS
jgi:DNA-binding transcriptional regulator WhiA